MCLERLLAIARDHHTCATEKARIDRGEILIPFDCLENEQWVIRYERARNRRQLLEALGY